MASQGYAQSSLRGKPAQAPGMMRHGPFPGHPPPSGIHFLEPSSHAEVLEKKAAVQGAEMDKLIGENRRLAATHTALRQELVASQHEAQKIHAHVRNIHNESDDQIRGLMEKIAKAEADIFASAEVRKELQKATMEGQSLFAERQELTAEIQHLTEGLQNIKADIKNLPELRAELEGMRQEHQRLRSAFEYEKNLNKEQVEQMCGMEKNLITMAKEVEKLRADILLAEKTAQAPHQHGSAYGNAPLIYPSPGQIFAHQPDHGFPPGAGYVENANLVGSTYPNSGYIHGGLAGYAQGYAASQGGNPYTGAGLAYPNGSIMPPSVGSSGGQVGDGTNAATYDGRNVGVQAMPSGSSLYWR